MVQKLFFLLFLWLTTYSNTQAQLPRGRNLLGVRLDWHPLGEMIAASENSSVHIYAADGVQIIRSLPSFPNLVTDVAWNPDGTKLAVANGYEIQIWQEPWNVNALQPELIIQSPTVSNDLSIVSVDWHPSAEKILGVNTPNAHIWDTTTGQIIETITPQQNAILSASWNNNGEQLGRGDIVGGVVIDNLATDTREFSEFFDRSGVHALSWSPAGDKVAAGSGSGILQIFGFSPFFTGNGYIETETEKIISLAWNPADDNLVASGSTDGSVAVWDVQTKQTVVDLQAGSAVPAVDWSPDGQKLAYGFEGGFEVVDVAGVSTLTPSTAPTATPSVIASTKWQINQELCPLSGYCSQIWRISADGLQLYVYIESTFKLYLIQNNGSTIEHDLSLLPGVGLPNFDFIPYDGNTIIILDDAFEKIYKYNLATQETSEFAPSHRFISCASISNPPIHGFTRINNFLVTCGYGSSDGKKYNLSVVNLTTQEVQEFAGLEGGEGRVRSWRHIVAGRDGSVYIQPNYGELLTSLVPNFQQQSRTHFQLLKRGIQNNQWDSIQIPYTNLWGAGMTKGELDLIAIDSISNLYLENWPDSTHVQYAKVSPQGEILWVVDEAELGQNPLFIQIDENGRLLILNYGTEGYTSTVGIQAQEYTVIAANTPTPTFTPTPAAPTLVELLSAPSCSIACFLGIEPGVTTTSEMEAILNERGIAFESYPIGTSGYITSYRLSINNVSPFIPNSTGIPASAGVMLGADIVEQIDISLINVTVSDVLAAYGAPEVVGKTGAFVLVYPSRGLVFFISRTDPTVVDLVYIRTQVSTQAVFGDVAPCVDQPIICNIQTATAIPSENITSTATATATATPAVTLRSIFNLPSCAVSCWLGIEPGMTTQVDLESILSGLNIQYDVSPIGLEGNTFDYSFNPHNNWPYVGNNQRSIGILVGDGVVFQMIVPLADVPIDTILGQYGPPDGIVGPAENRLLLYASYGLAFFVSRTDSTVVTSAWFSTQDGIVYTFVDNPNYPDIQPCTQPANLCELETATPSPSAVETGTP